MKQTLAAGVQGFLMVLCTGTASADVTLPFSTVSRPVRLAATSRRTSVADLPSKTPVYSPDNPSAAPADPAQPATNTATVTANRRPAPCAGATGFTT